MGKLEIVRTTVANDDTTNVRYTFLSKRQDGTLDSKAFAVKRQNYIDGNLCG